MANCFVVFFSLSALDEKSRQETLQCPQEGSTQCPGDCGAEGKNCRNVRSQYGYVFQDYLEAKISS